MSTVNPELIIDPRLLGAYEGVAGFDSRATRRLQDRTAKDFDKSWLDRVGIFNGQILSIIAASCLFGLLYMGMAQLSPRLSKEPGILDFVILGAIIGIVYVIAVAITKRHFWAIRLRTGCEYYAAEYYAKNKSLRRESVRPHGKDELYALISMAEKKDEEASLQALPALMGRLYEKEKSRFKYRQNLAGQAELEAFLRLTNGQAQVLMLLSKYDTAALLVSVSERPKSEQAVAPT